MLKGERGEMLLRGPNRMLGYWPEAGSGIDEDGYIHTSDVVRIDENGFFYIVDRTKDMIIVSGYKVYSREVDDILYHHPKVEMAATVGIPDPEREGSERVAVYIQPREKFRNSITEAGNNRLPETAGGEIRGARGWSYHRQHAADRSPQGQQEAAPRNGGEGPAAGGAPAKGAKKRKGRRRRPRHRATSPRRAAPPEIADMTERIY